jgi:hypothetical protein
MKYEKYENNFTLPKNGQITVTKKALNACGTCPD